ncbi:MAG: hypothetical protein ACR2PM_18520 [Hyphomicrobiales bacterium]
MADGITTELRALIDQPQEVRWAHYWSLVHYVTEHKPGTMGELSRMIVDQEEHLAADGRRPSIVTLLGEERAARREQAENRLFEMLAPLLHAEDTRENRAALAAERDRVLDEVRAYAEHAGPEDAYAANVTALDQIAAFDAVSARAFRPPPRQPRQSRQSLRELADAAPNYDEPQSPPRQPDGIEDAPAPPHNPPAAAAQSAHLSQVTDMSAPEGQSKRGRGGLVAGILVVICLIGAAGAGVVLMPGLFGGGDGQQAEPQQPQEQPAAQQAPTQQEPVQQQAAEQPQPQATQASTAIAPAFTKLYEEIMKTNAAKCVAPSDPETAKLEDLQAFTQCVQTEGTALEGSFRILLSQAGGRWLDANRWGAPKGPHVEPLSKAWQRIAETRRRWGLLARNAVNTYAASFVGWKSHGMEGWRFFMWRCRCNGKAELVSANAGDAQERVFLSIPVQVGSEDEARNAAGEFRAIFLGKYAVGKQDAVRYGATDANLGYGLPGGLGISRPHKTRDAAQQVLAKVIEFHAAYGYRIEEIK